MEVSGDQKEGIFSFVHKETVEDICPLLFFYLILE